MKHDQIQAVVESLKPLMERALIAGRYAMREELGNAIADTYRDAPKVIEMLHSDQISTQEIRFKPEISAHDSKWSGRFWLEGDELQCRIT